MSKFLDGRRGDPRGNPCFVTTHWSAVVAAGVQGSPEASAALEGLCQSYWYPLYAFVRRRGYEKEEAEDLTQAFFLKLVESEFFRKLSPTVSRFRSYLLASLKHFLANEWDRARSQKRGSGKRLVRLDDKSEERYQQEPVDEVTPEFLFERRWARTVLDQVLAMLRWEYTRDGKASLFQDLKPVLVSEERLLLYADIGLRHGLSEGAVKVTAHRLRRRYAELLRLQVAQTVANPREVEDELRHLVHVLTR